MNRYFALAGMAALALVCSCSGLNENDTELFCFKDSCQHLVVDLSLELPVATDDASRLMRDSLIADFVAICSHEGFDYENNLGLTPFGGDMNDAQAVVDYYGRADYDHLLKYAVSDYEGRMQYIDEDETMGEEYKEAMRNDVPQWTLELSVKKVSDFFGIVVYRSQGYVYYGGAHGGVNGSGALTFDKATGRKISRFLRQDATRALQPMIREGLLRYYGGYGETLTDSDLSDRLQLMTDYIPQPAQTPYPNAMGDSLVFTYRQYEIACYADGMPTFALAVSDLLPYMTEEGEALMRKANPDLPESVAMVAGNNCIKPLPAAFDIANLQDCTVPANINPDDIDWNNHTMKMEVSSMDLYDAVEVVQMLEGDTLIYDGDSIVISQIEETNHGMEINGGDVPEGGCILAPHEGGTYVALHIDMHATYTKLGTAQLPFAADLVLVNCGTQYTDPNDTIRSDVRTYLKNHKDISFHTLNTLVTIEHGTVTAITRRWIP